MEDVLGNPGFGAEIRGAIVADLGTALGRVRALNAELATISATATDARLLADPAAVADRLNRFTEVLAFDNPSRLNLELALHIDAIRSFPDRRVVVRTCKLGALTPAVEVLVAPGEHPTPALADDASRRGTPRKRSIRRLQTEDAGPTLREAAHLAADVNRFAGLGSEWFWEDEFRIPEPTCWSRENAAWVARSRAAGRGPDARATRGPVRGDCADHPQGAAVRCAGGPGSGPVAAEDAPGAVGGFARRGGVGSPAGRAIHGATVRSLRQE